jgi:hypothetical protein
MEIFSSPTIISDSLVLQRREKFSKLIKEVEREEIDSDLIAKFLVMAEKLT